MICWDGMSFFIVDVVVVVGVFCFDFYCVVFVGLGVLLFSVNFKFEGVIDGVLLGVGLI